MTIQPVSNQAYYLNKTIKRIKEELPDLTETGQKYALRQLEEYDKVKQDLNIPVED